ncbi:MAG TPA: DUF5916 domain-containing protein [Longimicrobium sp.]|nr:DUF5916 domain-containing protein [Longimicrobium sp.]
MMPSALRRARRLVIAACFVPVALAGQTAAPDLHLDARPRAVAAARGGPIALDGVLDEGAWVAGVPATGFRQQEPHEGRPASQSTEVRFLFDEQALYVGARMHDSLGAAGVRTRITRRDQATEGDRLQLVFDTYHDHAGRTVFTVNPSGVKGDAGQASPGADPSWDPVWSYAARVDSLGWTAEIRIPWSQLRFGRDTAQLWGMQIQRWVDRLNEVSLWSFWSRQEVGGPPFFGHLEGIRIRQRSRGVEIIPYLLARASHVAPTQPGSPFQQPRRYDARAGADVRMLLGSSFTLSATANPDFGQVEQDPAVVNLSAFESYFAEKRPFFVESSGLFFFGGFSCFTCSNVSGMNVWYSRRLGRAPQGAVPGEYPYREAPRNTRLLAAAKLTGRTPGGWQIGVLEAVTAREVALVQDSLGVRGEIAVEPLTNYWLGRVRRTTANGRFTWGVMATSVIRRFGADDGGLRTQLSSHAEALGIDWTLNSPGNRYSLMGNLVVANVSGDSQAIARLQRSSARYFQRPDRRGGGNSLFSDDYDTSAGRLRGIGGYLRAAREEGAWLWEAMVNVRSPGFEVNDIAFLQRADYAWMAANVKHRRTRPGSWYRTTEWVAGAQQQFNFDGDRTDLQLHSRSTVQLRNYWTASLFGYVRPAVPDDRMTRGGAVVRRSSGWYLKPGLSTDPRRAVVVEVAPGLSRYSDGSSIPQLTASVRWKPTAGAEVSVGPSFQALNDMGQYVQQFADPSATVFYGRRAIFAELRQRTLSIDTRVNWTFSPELTLELFAQPFVSTGRFTRFQEYVQPRSGQRAHFDTLQIRVADGRPTRYRFDPDRDSTTADFEFANPDFRVRSLRGSAVLRWEYRPGSTLFFVWQQDRGGPDGVGDFDARRDLPELFRRRPNGVFVVKASYWIGR